MLETKPPGREFRRMTKGELTERLHALQRSSLPQAPGPGDLREIEFQAVLQELEVHQIELEMQNRELRDSRQAADEFHERYLNLYDFAPVGYVTLTAQGVIREINLTAAGMLGVQRHGLKDRSISSWIAPEARADFRAHLKRCVPDQETSAVSLALVRKDQTRVSVELFSVTTCDPLTGEVLIHTALTDLSKRRKLEEALACSERSFQEIANAMPQVVWTAKPDGSFDWCNQWWYDYTGIPAGKTWEGASSPVHPEDAEATSDHWKKALSLGEAFQMEFRLLRKADGQFRWHLGKGVPIRASDGTISKWIGSSTDIHDQMIALHGLQEERRLRERFVEALTHDLRTPLTSAKISGQLLLRKADDSQVVLKIAERICSSMDRAEAMIRDLLDTNRIKAGERIPLMTRECRLDQLLESVTQDLSEIHGPRFELRNQAGPLQGNWDSTGLQRVVENLSSNAIKYGRSDSPVILTLTRGADWAEIAVHNEGTAISAEDQTALFNPYHRTQAALTSGQKGWGIGLTLIKGITEAHGGTARVESQPGLGTTFFIRLPLGSLAAGAGSGP